LLLATIWYKSFMDALRQQAEALRKFNRFYTARVGLLRGRYLNSEFSLTEARILFELAHTAEMTAGTLRRTLSLDAGYMSRLLASFEKRGLVHRKPSRQDRRAMLLRLTAAGKRSAARVGRQSSQEMKLLLQTLRASERIAVVESLGRVQSILSRRVIQATVSHAEDAWLLLEEYYREVGVIQKDTRESVQEFLAGPDSGLWIAYVEGVPAGCVVLRSMEKHRSAGECKRLYVRPQFRRRGIAEALLDALEGFAMGSSLSWIYLDSMDDLRAAIALYLRRGYEPCERYNENVQATVFLRKSLESAPDAWDLPLP
jgi:DNA-binding MarR family transcriptional regulator/ribosomal protein S18 acetylase RimI-like enzyme